MGASSQQCPDCGGTGWRTRAAKNGVSAARRCDCFEKTHIERLLQGARIPKRYRHCEVENFAPLTPALASVKKKVEYYIEEFPLLDYGQLFLGNCGVGKTHLAIGILKEIIRRYKLSGLFVGFHDLLKEIQASYSEVSRTSEKTVLKPVLEACLLVLDDLGAEKPSAWVQDTLSYVINFRYNNKLKTIITSNFPDLPYDGPGHARAESFTERIGVRLRSRLHEMCRKIEFAGDDFREKIRGPGLVVPKQFPEG